MAGRPRKSKQKRYEWHPVLKDVFKYNGKLRKTWMYNHSYIKDGRKVRTQLKICPVGDMTTSQMAQWIADLTKEEPTKAAYKTLNDKSTLQELILKYLHSETPKKSLNQQKDERYQLKNIMADLGHNRLCNISEQAIDNYLKVLADKRTPGQANRHVKCLVKILRWARRLRIISHRPFEDVNYFPVRRQKMPIPDLDEVLAFIHDEEVAWQCRYVCALMLELAQRRNDILKIKKEECTSEGIPILINKSIRYDKPDQEVMVMLNWNKVSYNIYRKIIELQETLGITSEYFICTNDGRKMSDDSYQHLNSNEQQKAIKRGTLTKRFRTHGLLALHAEIFKNNGGDIREYQKRRGHKSITTTKKFYWPNMENVGTLNKD